MEQKKLNKILFIDDDRDILTIARYSLESLRDVNIEYLSSGKEIVQKSLSFRPDLIILDVMMPEIDGITAFQELLKNSAVAQIPVIFITAKVQKDEVLKYLNMGVIDIIIKPFDPLTLASTIENAWNNFQSKSPKKN